MTPAATVIACAEDEWSSHVEEPPNRGYERIDLYVKEGLGWRSWIYRLGSYVSRVYRRNRSFAWCGAFAAWCYATADLSLKVRKKRLASTYRLHKWSGKRKPNGRRIEPRDLQPGDIGIVGRRKRYGDHIVIVVRVEGDFIRTIEGNAIGELPNGQTAEGVVKKLRHIEQFRYGVRPLPQDYDCGC